MVAMVPASSSKGRYLAFTILTDEFLVSADEVFTCLVHFIQVVLYCN